jgi:hypothetical protein
MIEHVRKTCERRMVFTLLSLVVAAMLFLFPKRGEDTELAACCEKQLTAIADP